MKKNVLFLAPLLVLSVSCSLSGVKTLGEESDVTLSDDVASSVTSFFTSPYRMRYTPKLSYYGNSSYFTINEEFSSTKRTSIIYANNKTLSEYYVHAASSGDAMEDYLDIHNTVQERAITDSDSVAVNFAANYGSPFASFARLSAKKVNQYFTVTTTDSGYSLLGTSLAEGLLTASLTAVLYDFDESYFGYSWDTSSLATTISDFTIDITSAGLPKSLSFTKTKKDRYGGIREYYSGTFTSLSEVTALTASSSSMSSDEQTEFTTKMAAFKSKLAAGNFTEHINVVAIINSTSYDFEDYSNYYHLDSAENGLEAMMLSDLKLTDSTNGETYTGIAYNSDGTLSRFGVSPVAMTSSALNSETFASIADAIPDPCDFGVGFFTLNDGKYVFDLSSFLYDDFYFSYYLLEAIYGVGDASVENLGVYYNVTGYSFAFKTLTLGFDDDGLLSGKLEYTYNSTYNMVSSFSFSDIGTTSIRGVEALKDTVSYIDSLGESIL